jgi:hypothetical protein
MNTANNMHIIDQVLKDAHNDDVLKFVGVKYSNPDFSYIVDRRTFRGEICTKPYFFLQQEVDAGFTPKNARRLAKDGWLRHLTLTSDGYYYDYIVHKYFDSIFDWVEDCGSDIKDVLFGQNHTYKPNGQLICVGLLQLLYHLHDENTWEYYGIHEDADDPEEESEYEEEEEEKSGDEMPPLVPVEVVVPQPPPPRGLTTFEKIIIALWILSLLNVLITNHEVSYDLQQFYLNATLTNSSF